MFHPYDDIEVASTTTFCRPNAPIFPLIAESRCFSGTFIIIFIRLLRKLELIKCWIWANTWRHIVSPTNHLIRVNSSPRKGVNYSGIRMQFPRLSCTWWKSITHRHRGAICVSLESGYNPCLMTRDKRAVEQWMRGGDTVKSKIRMPACDHWLWHPPRLQKYWAVNSDFLPHLVPIHIRRGLASCLGIRASSCQLLTRRVRSDDDVSAVDYMERTIVAIAALWSTRIGVSVCILPGSIRLISHQTKYF